VKVFIVRKLIMALFKNIQEMESQKSRGVIREAHRLA